MRNNKARSTLYKTAAVGRKSTIKEQIDGQKVNRLRRFSTESVLDVSTSLNGDNMINF